MSKLLTGSICLTDISDLLKDGKISADISSKNGKKYLSVAVWINDELDKFGNIASISHRKDKSSKTYYIGNLKKTDRSVSIDSNAIQTSYDDIPF